jgi:sec-independent protein translocase protein TatA
VGELGLPELLVILGIALLIFGPRKIGELGKGLGEGIRGFKAALSGEDKPQPKETPSEPAQK